ncbi:MULTISPECIES: TetR/AcrR family transcriptional regulator [Dietzia]|nr:MULTISPECIES: TetR/AcrR family transcriptional regulator [Dietzia]MEB8326674.1 TetR family transcriptional regulator [Dietzia kunjamensis]
MTRTTSRQLMIDAAEQIVAERGLPALTLKDVQIAANQSNKSAAKYHFGSREGLLDAVVDARMSRVNARRHEMLTALRESPDVPTSRQLVEALVRPLAAETLGRPESRYARFLVQAVFDPALAELLTKHLQSDSYTAVVQLITDRCWAPPEVCRWRVQNVVMLNMTALAAHEGVERTLEETDAIVSDLVTTCVAALAAPISPPVSSETHLQE